MPECCVGPATSAAFRLACTYGTFRKASSTDTKVMYAVHDADGRTAYIRVSPGAAVHGNMIVMDIARDQQEHGASPAGVITSVKRVR
jgi:hypothetical protein